MRRTLDSIGIGLTMGTMSEEETAYRASPEGQLELAEKTRKAYNLDKLTEQAKEHYGK
ncbi:hypothetical protein [Marivita sp.]|uniref:hypothetical protein n=1 Tax=Marivita sp. TaxID=2003365 RepID=UPI003F6A87B4